MEFVNYNNSGEKSAALR